MEATDRELDVTDIAALGTRIAAIRPDVIVHLAAQSSVASSWRSAELTYRVNYLGSRAILEATAAAAPEAPQAQIIDLMEALKASLAKKEEAAGDPARKPAKRTSATGAKKKRKSAAGAG